MKIERDPAHAPSVGDPTATAAAAAGAAAAAANQRTKLGAHGVPDDAAHAVTARPAATVVLSARSRELHEALRLAKASDDVRHDVVQQIKTQVENGTYSVDPAAIAHGMLDRRA